MKTGIWSNRSCPMDGSFYSSGQKTKPVRHRLHNGLITLYEFLPIGIRNAVASILAYEFSYTDKDNRLIAILKSIFNLMIAYFPLLYILRFIQRYFCDSPFYPFKYQILQTTTRV